MYCSTSLLHSLELVLVLEYFGRSGALAQVLLSRVTDVTANGGGVSKAAFIESALQEMSIT
jgi:hypothetical protein